MRYIGWILGGLYLIDGLKTLTGKRRAVKWFNETFGGCSCMPEDMRGALKSMEDVDERIITMWGLNNAIAGLGMIALASAIPCRCEHVAATEEAAKVGE